MAKVQQWDDATLKWFGTVENNHIFCENVGKANGQPIQMINENKGLYLKWKEVCEVFNGSDRHRAFMLLCDVVADERTPQMMRAEVLVMQATNDDGHTREGLYEALDYYKQAELLLRLCDREARIFNGLVALTPLWSEESNLTAVAAPPTQELPFRISQATYASGTGRDEILSADSQDVPSTGFPKAHGSEQKE